VLGGYRAVQRIASGQAYPQTRTRSRVWDWGLAFSVHLAFSVQGESLLVTLTWLRISTCTYTFTQTAARDSHGLEASRDQGKCQTERKRVQVPADGGGRKGAARYRILRVPRGGVFCDLLACFLLIRDVIVEEEKAL